MLKLVDGPVEGTYLCKRAPIFLRGVVDQDGKKDVLDLIQDIPKDTEKVYIYKLEGDTASVHLNFGGGKGGFYQMGNYRYVPDVDGEALRDNEKWQKWAKSQVE
jgi:hypothetical protein